ncbi:MAG: hypothetical protein KatS3mg002_0908 [Candidatus Woesearchaeota archaeon]|nr:MAG: hypothetical protein KatS3mg002_0908 [Candidatus Woesearchaeota archaeon]
MPKDEDILDEDFDELIDDEPIPARRDIRIFQRKKEEKKEEDEDFEEDVFV